MLIFESEIDDCLYDIINKSRVISYVSPLERLELPIKNLEQKLKIIAGIDNMPDTYDLYPLKSILVSTVWNLNDDIFDKYETYLAKDTPVNKPTNNNHIEKDIVGHMTGTICIDDNGDPLDDNISADNLPDIFHIVNSAVIYNCFTEPELRANVDKLIKEIEAGDKFVSMEASFRGFDYALKNSNGDMKILERNTTTAFLTKHLRSYGGTGTYQDYKVGRLLRGITFIGKGYVDRPANPQSIIFDKASYTIFNSPANKTCSIKELESQSGVFNTVATNHTGVEQNMNEELETKIAELAAANEAFVTQVAELSAKVELLQNEKTSVASELDANIQEKSKLLAENQSLAQQVIDLSTEKASYTEQIKVLSEQVEAAKKKEKMMYRKDKLKSAGYSDEDSSIKAELFDNLSDEQFDMIVAELVKTKSTQKTESKTVAGVSNNVDLENVQPEPVIKVSVATVIPEQEEVSKFRSSLSSLFGNMLQPKK